MKTLKVQESRLEQNLAMSPPEDPESISFFFDPVFLPSQKLIFQWHQPQQGIFPTINFQVIGPKHIGITGPNGVGKTTLLKQIAHHLTTQSHLAVGIMPQTYQEAMETELTPMSFLRKQGNQEESTIKSRLANLHFTKEEMESTLDKLSGGSLAKLFFLKLALGKYEVLLLDEPTRNLSPLSLPVFREALRHYQGAMIIVSHDRSLLAICDEVYELTAISFDLLSNTNHYN